MAEIVPGVGVGPERRREIIEAVSGVPGVPVGSMTVQDLEAYIALCFERQEDRPGLEGLGAHYVRRQVEWAEALLQQRLLMQVA